MYNPIVVCKMTEEEWAGQRIGNIPFRDRSLKRLIMKGLYGVLVEVIRGYLVQSQEDTVI